MCANPNQPPHHLQLVPNLKWAKYLILFSVILSVAMAITLNSLSICSHNGITVMGCKTIIGKNGEDPNILLTWLHPTLRDGKDEIQLPLSEIWLTTIQTREIGTTENAFKYEHVESKFTALLFYRAPGKYEIKALTTDVWGEKSVYTPTTTIDISGDKIESPIITPGVR